MRDFLRYGFMGQSPIRILMEGDGGAGSGGTGGEGGQGGEPKLVDFVDPVNGKTLKIPAELQSVIGHVMSKTRTDTEGKYKPMLEALEKEAGEGSQAKQELEKLRLEAMSAEERAQENAKQKIRENEKLTKAAQEEGAFWKSKFEESTIKTDIMSSFGDSKLCNSEQTAILFQIEGHAEVKPVLDDDGKPTKSYETRMTLLLEDKDGKPEKVEGTPKELFKRWIQLERNSHHLLNTMPAGSGSRSGGTHKSGADYSEIKDPVARMQAARAAQSGGGR